MKHKSVFLKSILSGVYLTIVVAMYLLVKAKTSNDVLASLLFSFALLLIVAKGYYLYTGKVGYLLPHEEGNLKMIGITILGNIIGILIVGLLINLTNLAGLEEIAKETVNSKFNNKLWYESFILSIFCGIMMYTAVDGYSRINDKILRVLVVILSVMTFLLAGFEHSIANMGYLIFAKEFSFKISGYLALMILGNGIGAVTINLIHTKIDKAS